MSKKETAFVVVQKTWFDLAMNPLVTAGNGPLPTRLTGRFFAEGRPLVAARPCLNVSSAELLARIRAEYLEMPGLRLTAPQAQCLFGLDAETWEGVLTALLDARFLSPTHTGQFAMAAI